jgi:alpha-L-rhamnosidase
VGHGSHAWETPDPAADDGRLPAQATVRDVLDHEQTWRQVVAAAMETGVAGDEAQAAGRLQAFLDAPARQLIDALAPPRLSDGGQTLHGRLDSVLPS